MNQFDTKKKAFFNRVGLNGNRYVQKYNLDLQVDWWFSRFGKRYFTTVYMSQSLQSSICRSLDAREDVRSATDRVINVPEMSRISSVEDIKTRSKTNSKQKFKKKALRPEVIQPNLKRERTCKIEGQDIISKKVVTESVYKLFDPIKLKRLAESQTDRVTLSLQLSSLKAILGQEINQIELPQINNAHEKLQIELRIRKISTVTNRKEDKHLEQSQHAEKEVQQSKREEKDSNQDRITKRTIHRLIGTKRTTSKEKKISKKPEKIQDKASKHQQAQEKAKEQTQEQVKQSKAQPEKSSKKEEVQQVAKQTTELTKARQVLQKQRKANCENTQFLALLLQRMIQIRIFRALIAIINGADQSSQESEEDSQTQVAQVVSPKKKAQEKSQETVQQKVQEKARQDKAEGLCETNEDKCEVKEQQIDQKVQETAPEPKSPIYALVQDLQQQQMDQIKLLTSRVIESKGPEFRSEPVPNYTEQQSSNVQNQRNQAFWSEMQDNVGISTSAPAQWSYQTNYQMPLVQQPIFEGSIFNANNYSPPVQSFFYRNQYQNTQQASYQQPNLGFQAYLQNFSKRRESKPQAPVSAPTQEIPIVPVQEPITANATVVQPQIINNTSHRQSERVQIVIDDADDTKQTKKTQKAHSNTSNFVNKDNKEVKRQQETHKKTKQSVVDHQKQQSEVKVEKQRFVDLIDRAPPPKKRGNVFALMSNINAINRSVQKKPLPQRVISLSPAESERNQSTATNLSTKTFETKPFSQTVNLRQQPSHPPQQIKPFQKFEIKRPQMEQKVQYSNEITNSLQNLHIEQIKEGIQEPSQGIYKSLEELAEEREIQQMSLMLERSLLLNQEPKDERLKQVWAQQMHNIKIDKMFAPVKQASLFGPVQHTRRPWQWTQEEKEADRRRRRQQTRNPVIRIRPEGQERMR